MPETDPDWNDFEGNTWLTVRLMWSRNVIENPAEQIFVFAEDAFQDSLGLSLVKAEADNPKELKKAIKLAIKRLRKLMPRNKEENCFLVLVDERFAHEMEKAGHPVKLEFEIIRPWHLRMTDRYKSEMSKSTSIAAKNLIEGKPGLARIFDMQANEMGPGGFYVYMKKIKERQAPQPSKKELKRRARAAAAQRQAQAALDLEAGRHREPGAPSTGIGTGSGPKPGPDGTGM